MLVQEFTARTGYTPTENEYKDIEAAYYATDQDKDAFCAQWKKDNPGRIADQKRATKRAEALEKAYKREKYLLGTFYFVWRYNQVTKERAKNMIEYTETRELIKKLGGKPDYHEVSKDFLNYANWVLTCPY